MPYQYGEAFKRLGIPGMGRQGAPWCGTTPDGTLVLMAHQKHFHKGPTGYFYELPRYDPMPVRGPSAGRSLKMLEEYFAPGRPIILPIAVFNTDGGPRGDGTFEPASFAEATGDAYRGQMRHFEARTAHLVCDSLEKFAY